MLERAVGLRPLPNDARVMVPNVIEDHKNFSRRIVHETLQEAQEGLCVEALGESEAEAWIVTQADRPEHLGRASDRLTQDFEPLAHPRPASCKGP